jgi:hypothetical protein
MTAKNTYWIADENGVKACVDGASVRDFWVRVQGYTETTEPTGLEFQWVRNEDHGGRGVMNHEAALLHAGLGWFPSDPTPVPGLPETEPDGVVETPRPVKSVPAVGGDSEGVAANG